MDLLLYVTVLLSSGFFAFFYVLLKHVFVLGNHWTFSITKSLRDVPGPKGIPILGSVNIFWELPEEMWRVTRKLSNQFRNGMYKIWALNVAAVNIYSPEGMEAILSSTKLIQKSGIYTLLMPWLNEGLLTSGGNKWKSRRKLLTPAFHFNILKEFVNVFEEHSQRVVESLKSEVSKDFTNVTPFVTEFALHTLCETTMGSKHKPDSKRIVEYKHALHTFGETILYRLCRPWLYSLLIYRFTKNGRIALNTIKVLHKFTTDVINDRLLNWNRYEMLTVESASGKKRCAMLDTMISQMKDGADIDYNGLREEVDTFMFEGHDTSSMGMIFFMLHLASNPHIQEKIVAERRNIIGNKTRKVTYEELQAMTYLEMCIKEALRICPPVPFISRDLTESVEIEGHTLAKGLIVNLHIYDLHHDPKIWPEPEKFDPERFTIEKTAKRHPFAYLPFSAGPRNCIGQKFAVFEMKSFISNLLWTYELLPVDTPNTVEFISDIVIRSKKEVKLKFRLRAHHN